MGRIQEGKQVADVVFRQCWPANSQLSSFELHPLSVAPKGDCQVDRIVRSAAKRRSVRQCGPSIGNQSQFSFMTTIFTRRFAAIHNYNFFMNGSAEQM